MVPKRLAERGDHDTGLTATVEAARFAHPFPFGHDVGRCGEVVFADVMDFIAEAVEGELETVGYVVGIVIAFGGVGEDGPHTVVASDDDEAFATFHIKNKIVGAAALKVNGNRNQVELDVGVFLAQRSSAQELGTQFLGFLLVDRASHQAADKSH